MLIAHIEAPSRERSGDWMYRVHGPGRALAALPGARVVDLTNFHRRRDGLLAGADVVVINMVCDADLLPLIAARKKRGQITVFEINDDVACLQPWNPLVSFYSDAHNHILLRMLIHACDGVQFSTGELERIYGKYNDRRAVFPNQMGRGAAARTARSDGSFVVGWGGSLGHLEDMKAVAPTVIEWVGGRADARLHLMCDVSIWRLFDVLPGSKKRHFPPGPIEDYDRFLSTLDVGIAPLGDTGFNRCRSDVKFLEMGLAGVAPVVQALAPYLETVVDRKTGIFFRTPRDLAACLDDLATQPGLRQAVAGAAREYVLNERQESAHAAKRLEYYRSLALDPGRSSSTAARDEDALYGELSRLEGAVVHDRHLDLCHGRFETLLLDAMILAQRHRRVPEALKFLAQAAALEPQAYRPHLYSAFFTQDKLVHLEKAITRQPQSLEAWIEMGDHLNEKGAVESAMAAFTTACQIAGTYDVPFGKLARLFQSQNDPRAQRFAEINVGLQAPFLP